MRVVLTGAAGGLGRRTARRLVDADHDVVAVDREEDGLAELPDGIDCRAVDLRDETAVERSLSAVDPDAVLSAVGWYELGALEDCPPDSLREHLEANLLAVHTPLHALMPGLRRREGRIVIVGSMVGSVPLPYHGAYSASKAGLDGYADSLRQELRPHGVDVSLIEPGPVRTGFNERATEVLDRIDDTAYGDQYRAFESYAPDATDPDAVVDAIVAAATDESPRARYRVSARANWLPRLRSILPPVVYDRLIRSGLPGGLLHRLIER
ncbi:SDR family NAD(P)-dependent oxidoreductase [Halovenus sp. WSH3]|uniref:SDR family NAD(P)-dependent oxidoreductase n=1 Tax=Halovenus carboxidivorans TaxID=2692199 RepID=A0A6B0T5K5_9EURY|nr:SDR family NAD(P)-dependent oxidoreductase [Halovenus carboxidivorans]MXR51466.1 SDR family NAD(P)-dependent oxidoreductase [Halovenus carboxidivorans]